MTSFSLILSHTVGADGYVSKVGRLEGEPIVEGFPITAAEIRAAEMRAAARTSPQQHKVTDPGAIAWGEAHLTGTTRRLFDAMSARIVADVARIKMPASHLSGGFSMLLMAHARTDKPISPYSVQWQFTLDGTVFLSVEGGLGPKGMGLHWSRIPDKNSGVAPVKVEIARLICLHYVDDIEALVKSLGIKITKPLDRPDPSRF